MWIIFLRRSWYFWPDRERLQTLPWSILSPTMVTLMLFVGILETALAYFSSLAWLGLGMDISVIWPTARSAGTRVISVVAHCYDWLYSSDPRLMLFATISVQCLKSFLKSLIFFQQGRQTVCLQPGAISRFQPCHWPSRQWDCQWSCVRCRRAQQFRGQPPVSQ